MKSKRKKRDRAQAPKVDYTASSDALARQLDKAYQTITDLEARLRAYRARLGIADGTEAAPHRGDPSQKTQVLLERLAGALQLASVAELAHATTPIHDGPPTIGLRDNARPAPGSSTHPARLRAYELRGAVVDALGRYDWAAENGWRRKPREDSDVPVVRCGNRLCAAYGLTEKVWERRRGGKMIYRQVCSTCAQPYPKADENGDAA